MGSECCPRRRGTLHSVHRFVSFRLFWQVSAADRSDIATMQVSCNQLFANNNCSWRFVLWRTCLASRSFVWLVKWADICWTLVWYIPSNVNRYVAINRTIHSRERVAMRPPLCFVARDVSARDGSFVNESFKVSDSLMRAANDSEFTERIVPRTNEECRLVNDLPHSSPRERCSTHLPPWPRESQKNTKNERKESNWAEWKSRQPSSRSPE
jgi:hypothetical protein